MGAPTSVDDFASCAFTAIALMYLLFFSVSLLWAPVIQPLVCFVRAFAPYFPIIFVLFGVVLFAYQLNRYFNGICSPPFVQPPISCFAGWTPEDFAQAKAGVVARKKERARAEAAAKRDAYWAAQRPAQTPAPRPAPKSAVIPPPIVRRPSWSSPLGRPVYTPGELRALEIRRQQQPRITTIPVPPPIDTRELFTNLPPSYHSPSSIKPLASRHSALLPTPSYGALATSHITLLPTADDAALVTRQPSLPSTATYAALTTSQPAPKLEPESQPSSAPEPEPEPELMDFVMDNIVPDTSSSTSAPPPLTKDHEAAFVKIFSSVVGSKTSSALRVSLRRYRRAPSGLNSRRSPYDPLCSPLGCCGGFPSAHSLGLGYGSSSGKRVIKLVTTRQVRRPARRPASPSDSSSGQQASSSPADVSDSSSGQQATTSSVSVPDSSLDKQSSPVLVSNSSSGQQASSPPASVVDTSSGRPVTTSSASISVATRASSPAPTRGTSSGSPPAIRPRNRVGRLRREPREPRREQSRSSPPPVVAPQSMSAPALSLLDEPSPEVILLRAALLPAPTSTQTRRPVRAAIGRLSRLAPGAVHCPPAPVPPRSATSPSRAFSPVDSDNRAATEVGSDLSSPLSSAPASSSGSWMNSPSSSRPASLSGSRPVSPSGSAPAASSSDEEDDDYDALWAQHTVGGAEQESDDDDDADAEDSVAASQGGSSFSSSSADTQVVDEDTLQSAVAGDAAALSSLGAHNPAPSDESTLALPGSYTSDPSTLQSVNLDPALAFDSTIDIDALTADLPEVMAAIAADPGLASARWNGGLLDVVEGVDLEAMMLRAERDG